MDNNQNITNNRYEPIQIIGHGGMARVYLAHDKILNRQVALKLLNEDAVANDSNALERFSLEAHAITSLIHPNIVEVYDICDIDNKHYIVMEYVEGHSLKQTIKLRGHIPPNEAVWIMKQLCSGIMEAHKNKIIHRDIKPQNVLIKNDGTVKIADFGIAVLNNSLDLTSKNTVLGSVHYLAPELSRGETPTMQSDIYSLGIVFFEMITGQVPYSGKSAVEIALKHFKEPLPNIKHINPSVPQSIVNIIIKATAKDVNERYENVALMLNDLNNCLNPEQLHSKPVTLHKEKMDKHKEMFTKSNKIINNKPKKTFSFATLYFIILSLISASCVYFLLVLSGTIKYGFNNEVEIPDITNLSVTEANDFLLDYGISIDITTIERELSNEFEENTIIRTIPEVGSYVDIGKKISVVVSGGQTSHLNNYIGKNIGDVESELLQTKIALTKIPVDSDEKPGTIISQDPEPDFEYNADELLNVTFEYSKYNDITLELSYKGRNVNTVYDDLISKGAKVEIVKKNKDEFSESERSSFSPNCLIYSEPALGTVYSQLDNNVIKLYCYGE